MLIASSLWFLARHGPSLPSPACGEVSRGRGASSSHSFLIERRRDARAVELERALLADGVRPLEDPVLPGGQTPENLGLHGLRAGKAQVRLHAGHGVRREACALLEQDAQLVVPVEILVSHGDEAELGGLLAFDRLADLAVERVEGFRLAEEARLQPRQAVAHRIEA